MARLLVAVAASAAGGALVRTLDSVLRELDVDCAVSWPASTPPRIAHAVQQLSSPRGCTAVAARGNTTGACWNEAITSSRAELCICLYEGDTLPAGLVGQAISLFHTANVIMAAAAIELATPTRTIERLEPTATDLHSALGDTRHAPAMYAFRRSDWERLNGFDAALRALDLYDFALRLLAGSPAGVVQVLDGSIRREIRRGSAARAELDAEARSAAMDAVLRKHPGAARQQPAEMLLDREDDALESLARHRALVSRRDQAVAALDRAREEIRRLEAFLRGHGRAAVNLGDLARPAPVSRDWGYDRGTPVDRAFIERFVASHAGEIRGRVLEVQEPDLTRRFGAAAVEQVDVLDIDPMNARATILADLRSAPSIPGDTYDCVVLTQTLHVIADMPAVVRECHRILKPGGMLLATLPCASRVCLEYGRDGDFYRLTEAGTRALVAPVFGEAQVDARAFGNVLTTTAFLQGLAAHELPHGAYEENDPYNPTLVGVAARKAARPGTRQARARPAHAARGRAAVLLYHRVGVPSPDVHRLVVDPASFAQQMDIIASSCNPVTLDDALDAAARRHLPHRAVAVTFDDGYRDNLLVAGPILAARGIPAAFCVTTAPLGGSREFWWDTLARVFAPGGSQPPSLDLAIDGSRLSLPTCDDAERRAAHDAVYGTLVRASHDRIRAAIDALVAWAGVSETGTHDEHAMPIDRQELLQLAAPGGHTIAAHGVDHLFLPAQPEPARHQEAFASRRALEDALGRDVRWFAYPFGAWDEPARHAVRRAGFDGALTCEPRALVEGDDLYAVPRVEVRCDSIQEFERMLNELFE